MNEYRFEMRVYPEDADSVGIVHHANLIKFMERARTDWLLSLGLRLDDLYAQGIFFVIKKIDIDYRIPVRMYDQLAIVSRIVALRKTMKTYEQTIKAAADSSKIYCQALIQVVCVNEQLRPQALPQIMLKQQKNGE